MVQREAVSVEVAGDDETVTLGDCSGMDDAVEDAPGDVVGCSTSCSAGAPVPDSRDRNAAKSVSDGEVSARLTALPANAQRGTLSITRGTVESVCTESI